tara:strand:- start:1920 stop:2093 length:174 start_codon:yes stop_codon:yes gene_type:complete
MVYTNHDSISVNDMSEAKIAYPPDIVNLLFALFREVPTLSVYSWGIYYPIARKAYNV